MVSQMPLKRDDNLDQVLDEFVEKGNLTTGALVDFTDLSRPTVTKRLDRLHAAECIEYLHEPTALWRLVEDPRETA
jgi:DNA-binding MarR family transcriptional regulator